VKERVIAGAASAEADWLRWLESRSVEPLDTAALFGKDSAARLVVIAPHPDDEVLACGGLIAEHLLHGGRCLVIAVTDGDASHLGSVHWTRQTLALARRGESAEGLRHLGMQAAPADAGPSGDTGLLGLLSSSDAPVEAGAHNDASTGVVRLGLPDAEVAQHVASLESRLVELLQSGDVVVTTWRLDGHPDHDATGTAVAAACAITGATLLEAPVWMWHWSQPGDARVPWQRLRAFAPSGLAMGRKQQALAAHVTQLTPRDEAGTAELEPVLGEAILQRSSRLLEYFFVS
jgi:LmbE family N-acetylglucosaminyl deacetylase